MIAIDGPAGAGKSTVAKMLAQRLGLRYLDTGAMYRAAALLAVRNGLGPDAGEEVAELVRAATIEFGEPTEPGAGQRVLLNGEDVTRHLRTPEMGELASALSARSDVRAVLATQQKAIISTGRVTLEGRDTTTVVAPNADLKIYLDADLKERTRRRHAELVAAGKTIEADELQKQIAERDHRDSTRADSPLMIAPDAHVIKTDGLSPAQVCDRIVALIPPG